VLVVIPAYNEERSIAAVINEVRESQPRYDVIVVDDGSADATAFAAREAGADVLTLPFNLGVGGAMRTGYLYAARQGYDAVVQVDGDGQHEASAIELLIRGLFDANVVVGSRFRETRSYRVHGPRRWAMWVLGIVLSRIARTRLTDVTSGFRAADRTAIRLFAKNYPAEYLGDTVESLVVAARTGLIIREVPVPMRARLAGRGSQRSFAAAAYLARALLALVLAMLRSREAIVPFRTDESALPATPQEE
jgi:glycosyltransferase involved in cell wall biosynthesis